MPWIYKQFMTEAQSIQKIELINEHIYAKVDRVILLCGLLYSIRNHIKNEEYLKKSLK